MCAVGAEVLQPPQVGLQLPAGQPGLQQEGQVAEDEGVQGGGAGAERGQEETVAEGVGTGWEEERALAAEGPQGRRGHPVLDLAWGGLPRRRQPGPEWDSIPGLHKGHIERPAALQAPPVPGSPPTSHTAPLSSGPVSVPRTSRPAPEPPQSLRRHLNPHLLPNRLSFPWRRTHASPKKNF